MHDAEAGHVHTHEHSYEHSHVDENGVVYTHTHDDSKTHTHTHTHEDGTVHSHTHTHEHSGHTHGHGPHGHVHSEEEKKAVTNRIAKAIGHMEHVKKMVMSDEDCSDVLIQLAAVRSAINAVGRIVLVNHIDHCVVEAIEDGDTDTLDRLEEAIRIFIK